MIGKLACLAVLLAVQGHAVVHRSRNLPRQGNFNEYYMYFRALDNARTPMILPGNIELKEIIKNKNENEIEEENGSGDDEIVEEDISLIPELNYELDTIVVVHGHGGDAFSTLNPGIKEAYFDERVSPNRNANFIVMDWSAYTKQSYSLASSNVHVVGRTLGEYLKLLIDEKIIQIEKLHLIGFNLGAHVVGFAGRTLGGLAARITGLDPSGSGWGSSSPRLSKSDARYVEVIHTDGDGLLSNGIGTAIGDVDIFANGGGNQPGCLTHACSHNRAYDLFAATLVRPTALEGRVCATNLQLSLNLCKGALIEVGGVDLFKRYDPNNSIYRANTGRSFPY